MTMTDRPNTFSLYFARRRTIVEKSKVPYSKTKDIPLRQEKKFHLLLLMYWCSAHALDYSLYSKRRVCLPPTHDCRCVCVTFFWPGESAPHFRLVVQHIANMPPLSSF